VLLVLQLLFWPARFSQESWVGYLGLLPLAYLVGANIPSNFRRRAFATVIGCAVAVSALLNLPSLSMSGEWGTINGKPWSSPELISGMLAWTVVSVAGSLATWRLGRGAPTPRPAAPPENGDAPGDMFEMRGDSRSALLDPLSPREQEIFELVARGMSNGEIAGELFIAEATVKSHVSAILAKLHATSRSELISLSYQRQLSLGERKTK